MAGASGWGRRTYCLVDIEFQFYTMKRVLEKKLIKVVNFVMCILQ